MKLSADIPQAFEPVPHNVLRARSKTPVMEGPPVLIQSEDEKYPDMIEVLSAAPAVFDVGAPDQCDRKTDLSNAATLVCLQ